MSLPSVKTIERDLTVNLQLTGTIGAGFVGNFNWGEIGVKTKLQDDVDLVNRFGKPSLTNSVDWLSAENFLKYVPNLTVVRVVGEDAANASNNGGVLIRNFDEYQLTGSSVLTHQFAARYAGAIGNSITVSVADAATYSTWPYRTQFDTAPASSDRSAAFVANANDEMHVIVIDRLGLISGVIGGVLEKFPYVSKAVDALDGSGQSLYYKSVIDNRSQYIYVPDVIQAIAQEAPSTTGSLIGGALLTGKPFVDLLATINVNLAGGSNGDLPVVADYVTAYEDLCSSDDASLRTIITGNCGGDANYAAVSTAVVTGCTESSARVAFLSPKLSDVQSSNPTTVKTNIIATYNSISPKNSYMHFSTGVKMVFDKYNNRYAIIPTNSDDAALYCIIGNTGEHWQSGAGYARGKYRNTVKLVYNPKGVDADEMSRLGINNVINENGEGIMLFGDRTGQGKNSAFRFMGTRMLFIELRYVIKNAAKFNLFEFNTDYTRSQFVNSTEPLIREYRGKNGIADGTVICDGRNNPTSVIERGEFVGSIIIKPQYSIQSVILNFSAVGRDVNFDEVVQQA